ncbi:CBS domain containing protein [Thermocrinis albus DSM 14484]|uniref:CBS domain containing protein n=1 Tax=Thermocrinis albus (strain DSM 14484 / JCM 11386 / HI 11/12) TaxID=638303 RepID=D3SN18_THEAH|nr:CBS domain-containing protein [Thermocrinis albus]ADC90148.1 CBS domain containing protein [Thermocrinis albus DSM 14484]
MRELDLSELATGVPKVDYDLGIPEALRSLDEHRIFDFLVVVKDSKPVGIVYRKDLLLSQGRKDLRVGDIALPLPKIRTFRSSPENLLGLLDFFAFSRKPLLVVDKRGQYLGVLFYHVLLHYMSSYRQVTVPIFQKLRKLFGQDYHLCVFYLKDVKGFREHFGSAKEEGLYRILYEDVKDHIDGDVMQSQDEREIYALSKRKLSPEEVKAIMEEFHKEFSLLYAEINPVHVVGFDIGLKDVKSYEEFWNIYSQLKNRLKSVHGSSFFVFHGLQPVVVTCEYPLRQQIMKIKEKIKEDFLSIVEELKRTEKDLWEYILYDVFKKFPYFELFYIMNEKGLQISNNVVNPKANYVVKTGKKGADRSQKIYFKKAMEEGLYVSEIYISQATDDFCITVSAKFQYGQKVFVLAGDINYREIHRLVKEYSQKL